MHFDNASPMREHIASESLRIKSQTLLHLPGCVCKRVWTDLFALLTLHTLNDARLNENIYLSVLVGYLYLHASAGCAPVCGGVSNCEARCVRALAKKLQVHQL